MAMIPWDLLAASATLLIFCATYLVVAVGRLPGWHLDRTGAALVGASLMVAVGGLSLEHAYAAIDLNTIVLLLGMMILVAHLRLSGFFRLVSTGLLHRARSPLVLLAMTVGVTGLFSAFLVNDTICLMLTPLVLDFTTKLKRDPLPYLLATAMASNVGSVATLTGNPQNMLIGHLSHIPYWTFTAALGPIAIAGLLLTVGLIALAYRREFFTAECLPEVVSRRPHCHRSMAVKSVGITVAMMAAFFTGFPIAEVAIVGASLLLITRQVKPGKVYRQIDWPLLVLFAGLFIVVAGLASNAFFARVTTQVEQLRLSEPLVLSIITAALSNLVSNVPAVLVLKSFITQQADPQRAWLVVAMAATLAGNFTVLGSIANLIVVEQARAQGVEISFWQYFKVGAPLTLLTLLIGVWWL
jgi:Na+/H+ antiporter NhaD/arsenite permease-like protein